MDYFFNEEEIDYKLKEAQQAEENRKNERENWKLSFGLEEKKVMQDDAYFRTLNMIYWHFSPLDLLNLSLVCKEWYSVIGVLDTFATRIKLNYCSNNKQHMPEDLITAIKNTRRIYENIEITVWNDESENIAVENIIFKYSGFVKNLKLIKFGGHNSILNVPMDMPNLEELEIQAIGGRLSAKFVENVRNLKKLTVNGIEPRGLKNILIRNAGLTEVTLYENGFIGYFKKDITKNVTCKLNKLKIFDHANQIYALPGEFPAEYWSLTQRCNFLKFLSIQNNLCALHLDACRAEDINQILSVSSLEMLEINKIIGTLEPSSTASSNVEIFLTKFEDMNASTIETLFTYMPNILSLFIYSILKDEFLKIIENEQITKNLLNFYYFWASEKPQGKFLNLKTLYQGSINVSQSTKNEFIDLFGP